MSTKTIVVDGRESPGEAIDRLSREQGRTKWWVAKELATHPSHLSKLISGERRITERMAVRLAELFNVPASTFVPDETAAPCHCDRPAQPNGNGLADTCAECLALWIAAGEPELCPCASAGVR